MDPPRESLESSIDTLDGSLLGLFTRHGVLTQGIAVGETMGSTRVLRLETTWRHDSPSTLQSRLRVDVISSGGAGGNA